MRRKRGFYSISVVSQMFGIHQQTIRMYEKEGLISPTRSEGGTRLFSEEDVNKLEEIVYLTNKLGINVAGVEMVLKLQRKIKRLKKEISALFDQMNKGLEDEGRQLHASARQQAKQLMEMKQGNRPAKKPIDISGREVASNVEETQDAIDDDWKIDYEE